MASKKLAQKPKRTGQIISKGDGLYLIRFYQWRDSNGKRIYPSKEIKGTYGQAEKALAKWVVEKEEGTFVAPTKLTLQQYLLPWIDGRIDLAAKSKRDYRARLVLDILPTLGHVRLDVVTRAHLQKLVGLLVEKGQSRRTIQYSLVVLSAGMNQAIEDGYVRKNPCTGVLLPSKERKEMVVLSAPQITQFLHHESTHRGLWFVLLTAGLRPQEALALQWTDINMADMIVSINKAMVETTPGKWTVGPTKNTGTLRTVTVPQETVEALKAHKAQQNLQVMKYGANYNRTLNLVFAGRLGKHLDMSAVRRHWKADLAAAKLPEVSLYGARHSHATLLLAGGTNPKVGAERLGNSVEVFMTTYSHVLPTMQRQASDLTGSLLFPPQKEQQR